MVEGRSADFVEENIDSIVDSIIEESIGYHQHRSNNMRGLVVDRSDYSSVKDSEYNSSDKPSHIQIAIKDYLRT